MSSDVLPSPSFGLHRLPELIQELSPLQAIGDLTALAQCVAASIVKTVGVGCRVYLEHDGDLRLVVDTMPAAASHDELIDRLLRASRRHVVAGEPGGPTWVIMPLRGPDGPLGALSVAIDAGAEELDREQSRQLDDVAGTLARALAQATAYRRANLISQTLQASLLPSALPKGDWFEVAARYVPGTADLRIGGDWYDSQLMSDGTVALSVGDVAGHGVDAAAQMGELRSAMTALRLVRSSPDELISVVHRLATDMGYFATVICARLDPTGNLQWASAGHLPAIVVHEDRSVDLLYSNQSPPLGVGHVGHVPVNRHRLNPGDTVLLYTDGLIERRDESIDDSLKTLTDRATDRTWTSPGQLIDLLLNRRENDESTGDDTAVLAARWLGPRGQSPDR